MICTRKVSFCIVNEIEVDGFGILQFSCDPANVDIFDFCSLFFSLNPASGHVKFFFTQCWSLAGKILPWLHSMERECICLMHCILFHTGPFLGMGCRLIFPFCIKVSTFIKMKIWLHYYSFNISVLMFWCRSNIVYSLSFACKFRVLLSSPSHSPIILASCLTIDFSFSL